MSRPLNAPPIISPAIDANGKMTAPWTAWFREVYSRIGEALGRPTTAIDADVQTLAGDSSTTATALAALDSRLDTLEARPPLPSYTVAGAPTAVGAAGKLIYVTNETGGPVVAFSDGTAWRRVTDRAVIA
jgi:hypothetical protein